MENNTAEQNKSGLPDKIGFSLKSFAPNFVTMLACACGISSIRFSIAGNWAWAVGIILIGCIFDALDGRVARLLHVSTRLGAELDSLSDFVSFGVAPGILVYFWLMRGITPDSSLYHYRDCFWGLALFFALCCGYRLARFNIMLDEVREPYWKHFFLGLPAPGGAALVMVPVAWEVQFGALPPSLLPILGGVLLFVCGFLMASRIPTLSAKAIHIPKRWAFLGVLAGILIIGMLIAQVWLTLIVIGIGYYVTIPLCIAVFVKLRANYKNQQEN